MVSLKPAARNGFSCQKKSAEGLGVGGWWSRYDRHEGVMLSYIIPGTTLNGNVRTVTY